MRKTINLDDLTQAYDEYEELLHTRVQAAIEAGELFKGIDPAAYYTIAQTGAFAVLKMARKLAGYK